MYNPKELCYLCNSTEYDIIHHGVRGQGKSPIDVLKCKECGLVRLSSFITDDDSCFYENSGMWTSDGRDSSIAIARIEAQDDDKRRAIFAHNYIKNKDVLDFGCGSGGFLNEIKDSAKSIAGVELEKDKRDFLISEGMTCYENIDAVPDVKYDIITLFHVLEHLPDPIAILNKLKRHLSKDGKIIIEVPNADDALLSLYKSEEFANFTYWVCHLYLYTNKTIVDLINKCDMDISLIQQIQRYPLSNHLYWLSKKSPGGHKEWAAFNDDYLDKAYGQRLASLGIADTIIAVIKNDVGA